MKHRLLTFALCLLASASLANTDKDVLFHQWNASTNRWDNSIFSPAAGKVVGFNGSGTIVLMDAQSSTGTLALGGFASITGTLPLANGGFAQSLATASGVPSFNGAGTISWLGTGNGSSELVKTDASGNIALNSGGALGFDLLVDKVNLAFALHDKSLNRDARLVFGYSGTAYTATIPSGGGTLLYSDGNGSSLTGLTKSQVGLGSVENTALSTWAGSTSITTIGTLSAGAVPTTLLTGTITNAQLAGSIAASKLVGTDITTVGTITSGTWSGAFGAVSGANLTTLNASNLASGTVNTARLGSGTANSTTYLRGDNTWATISTGITIGTSAITSGTSGRILYDNAGVVGELTTTGSGTVVALATSPTFTTPILGTPTSGTLTNCTGLPAASVLAGSLGSGAFTLTSSSSTEAASLLTLTGQTALSAASQPLINGTQTWNNGSTTFTALKFNITNTASAAASALLDLQVGGTSVLKVSSGGLLRAADGSLSAPTYSFGSATNLGMFAATSVMIGFATPAGMVFTVNDAQAWIRSNTGEFIIGAVADIRLTRVSAGIVKLNDGGTGATSIRVMGDGTKYSSFAHNGTNMILTDSNSGAIWRTGAGSPEGVVTAPVGSLYTRTDGGASTTLYVKESGAGNTGWIAK